MPYVSPDGTVVSSRPLSVATVMDYMWGVVDFVNLFFRSLFHLDDENPRGRYGNNQRAPRTPGGRRMGGIGGVSGVAAPPACGPSG